MRKYMKFNMIYHRQNLYRIIMILKKYFIVFLMLCAPLAAFSNTECPQKPEKFCRSGPILTATAIIEVFEGNEFKGIVLVDHGMPHLGKTLPGGKVAWGESVENTLQRKTANLWNLELYDIKQFHVYSDPNRVWPAHFITVAHVAKAYSLPISCENSKYAYVVKLRDIPWNELGCGHAEILRDYLAYRNDCFTNVMIKP